jgi:glycerol-3-phosphate dehydrogenase (NAD(P)+)
MAKKHAIAVLGAGSWGTALALVLARNGHETRLWGHESQHLSKLKQDRENRRYLPSIGFPSQLILHADLSAAIQDTETVLVVVPSYAYAETLRKLKPYLPNKMGIAWATKGLERGSGRFLHEVTRDILGDARPIAIVSGPSFAQEVALGLPTAITVASEDSHYARQLVTLLHGASLRAYTSVDVIGVELGGAVKNVLAIATGVADGLGFGANARAAIITRGLAEMERLGKAVGGRQETFMGLAGIGDLVLTCTDNQSRNRRFGLAIGRGQTAPQAQADIDQVIEGAETVQEISRLAAKHQVEMPITEQVNRVLHEHLDPRQAVESLLARDPKPETF